MGAHPYAGIGSRATPPVVLAAIEAVAADRARAGWVLRTGMSPGADRAFHRGARAGGGIVELYLPWPGFADDAFTEEPGVIVHARPSARARQLAARHHPRWAALGERERALLARDCEQVLGSDLASPVAEVICWTPDGSLDGEGLLDDGTGQALRVAREAAIPVLNLARPEHMRRVRAR
jgi:hypothetical protein